MSSSPAAGVEISPAIPVDLVVSDGPEVIEIPDVTGLTERDAIATLTDLGLKFTVSEEYDNQAPDGEVIRTDPSAGAEALSGDTILIVVSLGPAPVTVPDLKGMTEAQARSAVEGVGLQLRDGLVVSQVPTAGSTAGQGDTITVTLGEFVPPPTTTTIPPTTTAPPPTTP